MKLLPVVTNERLTHYLMNTLTDVRDLGLLLQLANPLLKTEDGVHRLLILFGLVHFTILDALSHVLRFAEFQAEVEDFLRNNHAFVVLLWIEGENKRILFTNASMGW